VNQEDREYLDRMIEWMKSDVEKCSENDIDVGLAVLICCYLDALAGFLVGSESEGGSGKEGFVRFVRKYLKVFMANAKDVSGKEIKKRVTVNRAQGETADLTYSQILYKVFRCGFVHEHLAKVGGAIIKDRPEKNERPDYISEDPKYGTLINITRLKADFLQALHDFHEDVLECATVQTHFVRRLRFLLRKVSDSYRSGVLQALAEEALGGSSESASASGQGTIPR